MRGWWGGWFLMLTAAGCNGLAKPALRPTEQQIAASPSVDLPQIDPVTPVLTAPNLPKLSPRAITGPEGVSFRRVREVDCLVLAANNATTANLLEQESNSPTRDKHCK